MRGKGGSPVDISLCLRSPTVLKLRWSVKCCEGMFLLLLLSYTWLSLDLRIYICIRG